MLAALAVGAAVVATPTTAAPVPAVVTLEPGQVTLEQVDGVWSAEVTVTNQTAGRVTVAATASGNGCVLTLGKPSQPQLVLAKAAPTSVPVNIGRNCSVAGDPARFDFSLIARAPGTTPLTLPVQAKATVAADATAPHWSQLNAFWVAFVGFGVVVLLVAGTSSATSNASKELPYVGDAWTFKDSWATNVTAAGAIVVGVLASTDVLEALLGDDAESVVALVAAGAAISLGFAAAGGLVAAAGVTSSGKPTVWGFLAGAILTLTGVAGQIGVLYLVGQDLFEGSTETISGAAAVLGLLLLLLYAVRSVRTTLEVGTTPPPLPNLSEAPYRGDLAAAIIIASALRAGPGGTLTPISEEELSAVLGEPKSEAAKQAQTEALAEALTLVEAYAPPPKFGRALLM